MEEHKRCVWHVIKVVIEHCLSYSDDKYHKKDMCMLFIKNKLKKILLMIYNRALNHSKRKKTNHVDNANYNPYCYQTEDIEHWLNDYYNIQLICLNDCFTIVGGTEYIINGILIDIIGVLHDIFNYKIYEFLHVRILKNYTYQFGTNSFIKGFMTRRKNKCRQITIREYNMLNRLFSIKQIKPFSISYCIKNNIRLPLVLRSLCKTLPIDMVGEIGKYLYVVVSSVAD